MADGALHVVYDADGQHIVQKFRVELRVRRDAQDGCGFFVAAQADGVLCTGAAQALLQHGQEPRRGGAVDEQDLGRIADGRAARFCVFNDIERHIKIGALVNIDMADARAGLDARHGRVLDARADKACPAARDEQVNIARGCHESGGPCVGRVLHKVHEIRRQTGPLQPAAQRGRDGGGGAVGLAPGAQHADVAGLQRERGGVRRDVRAALIDDGDDAHRHAALADAKAVRTDEFVQRPADRVRQGSNGLDAGCHALEPGLVQREAVEHDVRDFAARGLEIGGVLRQNGRCLRAQLLRHGGKGAVFRLGVAQGRTGRRGLRALQNDLRRGEFHYAFSSRARNFVPTGLPSIRS